MKKRLREKRRLFSLIKGVLFSVSFLLANIAWSQCNVTTTSGNPATVGSFPYCLNQGTNIVFTIGGTFTHAGGTTNHWVAGTSGITIDGNGKNPVLDGSLLNDASNTWKQHVLTVFNNNITIKGIVFKNAPNRDGNGGAGVIIADGFSNITFQNCEFNNNTAAGLQNSDWTPAGPATGTGSANVTVTNCKATGNKLSGIQLVRTKTVNVSGGEYYNNQQSGIYFERGITNAIIDAVKVYGNGLPATGNTNANAGAGIRVYDGGTKEQSTKITISNSQIYNNNIHGVELPFNSDEVNVFKNEIYGNGTGTSTGNQACGVVFQFGGNDNCTVAENDIYDNRDAGIYMYRTGTNPDHSGNIFYKNTVTNNGGGIIVISSSKSYIAENTISGTTDKGVVTGGFNGIYFGGGSDDGIVYKNTVTGTANGAGIHISDEGADGIKSGSNNVYILGNTLDDNKTAGVYILNSNNAHIGASSIAPTPASTITRTITDYGTITIPATAYATVERNTITKTVHCIEAKNANGVDIDGSFIGTSNGVTVGTNTGNGVHLDNCTNIKIGLVARNVISGNPNGYGIYATQSTGIKIYKNYIGVNSTATAALANGKSGIYLDATNDSEIGDGTVANRNVISGNKEDGITITNIATNVKVLNNYIGLHQLGTIAIPNGGDGINMTGANKNQIIGNIISGNTKHGIAVQNASTSDNKIQKNIIGLNASSVKIANGGDGIYLDNCKSNFIGGIAGEGNVISGNGGYGISLNGTDSDLNKIGDNKIGIDPLTSKYNIGNTKSGIYISSSATNNTIGDNGSTSVGNIISGNGEHGIDIDGSINNKIDGNIIGMNDTKTNAHKNGVNCTATQECSGIHITNGASNNEIGLFKKNTIAGDHQYQILIDKGANGNKVQKNDIGIDNTVVVNGESVQTAIKITGAGTDNNEIGLTQTEGNLIVHSSNQAVLINAGAKGNKVSGNTFIGSTGSSPTSAITIDGASQNIIGGVADNTGNIIQKTAADAIIVKGTSASNEIQTNFIGTNATGTTASGPIKGHGIVLTGSGVTNTLVFNNTIGMLDDATKHGIYVNGIAGTSQIYGNYIGVTKTNVDVANAGHGIFIDGNATGVSIGKTGANPNIIANSGKNGIEVTASTNTTIINNHIGTNVAGTSAKANKLEGIHVGAGNSSLTITENVISGNTNNGILVDNNVAGTNTISKNKIGFNATAAATFKNGIHAIKFDGATTNFTVSENEIGGHTENAIEVTNSQNITFSGNFIGTNKDGKIAFANTKNGIHLGTGSGDITINNSNVISGNTENGILIDVSLTGTNTISGNTIGLMSDKTKALTNGQDGIHITGNTGTINIADNSIGGNTGHGVQITGSQNVTLSANKIGVEGTTNLGNTKNGIEINATSSKISVATGNTIGFNQQGINVDASSDIRIEKNDIASNVLNGINAVNTSTKLQIGSNTIGLNQNGIYLQDKSGDVTINTNNVIGGNLKNGIHVDGNLSGTNTITGNIIGLNGAKALKVANGQNGIQVNGNSGNLSITTNTIGGNTQNGINLEGSSNTTITGNIIGTSAALATTDLGNVIGINVINGSVNNTIGTNTIAYNKTDGIVVDAAASIENTITQNSMYCNAASTNFGNGNGITLSNSGNTGIAPNIKTLKPALLLKDSNNGGKSTLVVDLTGIANVAVVEVFENDPDCKNCQGKKYVSSATLGTTTSGDPVAFFNFADNKAETDCNRYVVTVTDASGNTSAFSSCSECACKGPSQSNYDATTQALTGFSSGTIETCKPNTITLGAEPDKTNAPDDFFYTWYKGNPTSAFNTWTEVQVPTKAGFTFKADPTTHGDGTYFFVVSYTNDVQDCSLISDPLILKFNPSYKPTTDTISYCKGETPAGDLSSQVKPEGTEGTNPITYTWYDAATAGNKITPVPTANTTIVGVKSYWISETVLGCEGARTELKVTIKDVFTPTTALLERCEKDTVSSVALVNKVTKANAGTLTWYSDASVVTGSATAPTLSTTTAGTTSYFVTETVNKCEGPRVQIDFTVNALPTVTFDPIADLCENGTAITLASTATVSPTGGVFSYGTPSAVQTSFDPKGKGGTSTTVTYEVTDAKSCKNSTTQTIAVNAVYKPTTTAISYCKDETPAGDLSSQVKAQGTETPITYTWYTVATGGVGSTTAPTADASTVGKTSYWVTETVLGCEGERVELVVTVQDIPTPTTATLEKCKDATVAFSELEAKVTKQNATGVLTWYTASTGGTGSTTLSLSTTTAGTTSYFVTEKTSCEGPRVQIDFVVNALPTVTFDPLASMCDADAAINLASTATVSPTGGVFSYGTPSAVQTSFDPKGKGGTTTTITYTFTDAKSCKNSTTSSVAVTSAAKPVISGTKTICEGASTTLTASGASTYTWSPSTGLDATTGTSVNATLTSTQVYTVNSVDGNGCKNSETVTVTVNKNPTVTIAPTQICEGKTGSLKATPSPAGLNYTYSWTGGKDVLTDNPTVTTPYKLTITNTTTGCVSTEETGTITVNPVPVAQMTLVDKVCSYEAYDGTVANTNPLVASYSEVWTFNGQSIAKAPSFSASDAKESGTYTVKLVSSAGCESKLETKAIKVVTPTANISVSSGKTEIKEGQEVTLLANAGSTDYTYAWTIDNPKNAVQSSANPVTFAPVEDITYYVTATTEGCEAVAEQFIKVRSKIVIPNGFTPNGDGKNEVWIIKNIEDYENAIVRVYNRWGNLIYQSEPGYKIPWDGLTDNGNPMPVATYYYIVELKVDNEEYAGSVTIVR